jgi:hypothetical protein
MDSRLLYHKNQSVRWSVVFPIGINRSSSSVCYCRSKQGHGQIDHFLGPGDHDRAPLKTPKPMALLAVVPFNAIGSGFAHPQFPSGHDSGIHLPVNWLQVLIFFLSYCNIDGNVIS